MAVRDNVTLHEPDNRFLECAQAANAVYVLTSNKRHFPSPTNQLAVSPHVLRHTFLRRLAEEKGVQYAKEASSHKSDRYIWWYVKPGGVP